MSSVQRHQLAKTESGWKGHCPYCQNRLIVPLAMYNAECFTCEINCSGCSHRFSVKVAEDDSLDIALISIRELERTVTKIVNGLQGATADIDTHFSASKAKLEKLRTISAEGDKLSSKTAARLNKLAQDTSTQCDAIRDEVTGANIASAVALADVNNSINKMSSAIEVTQNQLQKARERIGDMNPLLADVKRHIEIITRQLANWSKIIQVNTHASLYTPLPPVRGAPAPPLFSLQQPLSGNGTAPQDEATNRFRELLQSPETIKQFVAAFPNGFSVNLERNRAYESLPHLFDVVEQELYSWNHPERAVDSETTRQAVIEVLQRMLLVMRTWQEVNGLKRYGAEGELYDYVVHEKYMTCETNDAEKFECIKDVVYSGYRLQQDGTLLRRARVVIWVPAMNLAPNS